MVCLIASPESLCCRFEVLSALCPGYDDVCQREEPRLHDWSSAPTHDLIRRPVAASPLLPTAAHRRNTPHLTVCAWFGL
jgi:hypothetical protein